jgi:hypothetical protein
MNKKTKILLSSVLVIVILLILIGFLCPQINRPLSPDETIRHTRVELLDNYKFFFQKYIEENPQNAYDINHFKAFLAPKLTYQTDASWQKAFKDAYGDHVSPWDVFEIVCIHEGAELKWGILEVVGDKKHPERLCLMEDGRLYLIKRIDHSGSE